MAARTLYSIKDAREQLGGISRNTIYRLLNEGKLTSIVIGSRRFITAAAIARLVDESSTSETPAEKPARDPESKKIRTPPVSNTKPAPPAQVAD
jgi:excisionase family DNA binding protein